VVPIPPPSLEAAMPTRTSVRPVRPLVVTGDDELLDDLVRLAAAAGAYAVGIPEVIPSIPHTEELDAFMNDSATDGAR